MRVPRLCRHSGSVLSGVGSSLRWLGSAVDQSHAIFQGTVMTEQADFRRDMVALNTGHWAF